MSVMFKTIYHDDGRKISRAGFMDPAQGMWEWVIETICDNFGCSETDIVCCDTDDRLDNIMVDGKIVAFIS